MRSKEAIAVTIDLDLIEKLKALTKRLRKNRSRIVNEAVEAYVKDYERKEGKLKTCSS